MIFPNRTTCLNLENQSISYKELLFLSPNVKYLSFDKCAIKKENGSILQLEELLQIFHKLIHFTYKPILSTPTITAKTFKELLKIPHFTKIHYFYMWCIPDNFDIESFYDYMKKNKSTVIRFYFDNGISAAYKARIETIIDEIIATQNHDFKVPYIYFEGLVEEKHQKLRLRFHGI
uniref:Uncharacterized protein n=1 Tax=Panagrolaimus davidi TaxID=227884 RepID=A0A914QE58_9BILA